MTATSDTAGRRAIGPWTALVLGVVAFVAIYTGVQGLRIWLLPQVAPGDVRTIVAWRAATSLALIWPLLGAIAIILKLRGQSLRGIGWLKPSSALGWLLAVVVIVLYCGFTWLGPLRHAPFLSDWSAFRIGTALTIGVSAGVCEETVFRGFVMGQARDAGLHWSLQLILSAVLFGLAHVGWGGLKGHFELMPMIASMTATLILGAMLAIVYLVSRRSLMPAIVAHGAIDMVIEPWLLLFMVTGGHFG